MSKFNPSADRLIIKLSLLAACLLLAGLSAFAQTTANIVGTVQDQSGAVVPDAKVTAVNQATGLERTAATDGQGGFIFAALPIGSYRVRCEKQGFKAFVQENVVLQIAQEVRLNVELTVGAANEEITVTTGVTLTNTENAELGEVIENKRIVDLPLNGRQFLQLAELTPGISRGPTGGFRGGLNGTLTGPNITVNGARDTDNYFTIDGVSANDRFFNTLTVSPSVEAIQEFKVQSNLYSAENGVTAGAQINIAIKSGSNDFHGSAYEFFRNDRLNARNFFDVNDANRDGRADRPVYQQNQFGFTLGGRLWKDRTFFFGNMEWLRLRVPQSRTLSVATARMRAGDLGESLGANLCRNTTGVSGACGGAFTDPVLVRDTAGQIIQARAGMVFDPFSAIVPAGQPGAGSRIAFAGNVIPQNRWNNVAKEALALAPQANLPGLAGNLAAAPSFRNRTDQFNVRLDHRFSEQDAIYGRYIFSNIAAYSPFGAVTQGTRGGAAAPGFGWNLTTDNRNLAVNYQRVWSPKFITEFRFGYNKTSGGQKHQNVGNDIGVRNKIAGITGFADDQRGIPRFSITGLAPFGDEPNTIIRNNEDFQYDFNASYTLGQHQTKYGFSFQKVRFAPSIQNLVRGTYSFTPSSAGSGVAFGDFLLGIPTGGATAGAVADADFRGNEYYWYAQDSWRARPNLTLTYGLRYEYQQPLEDQFLTTANFDLPSRTIIIPFRGDRLGGPFISGTLDGGFRGLGAPGWPIRPAWQLGIGPGLTRPDKNNFGPRFGFAWNALKDERLIARGGYGIYYNRKEQFANSTLSARPPFGYSASLVAPAGPCLNLANGTGVPCTAATPQLQIENALTTFAPFAFLLPVDTDLRTGYVQQWNLTVQTKIWRNWLLEAGYVGSKGTKLFGFDSRNYRQPSTTVTPLPQTTREFQPYTSGLVVWDDGGASTYNSLQLRLVKRLSSGLQFSSNYTWAKSIDNNSVGSSGSNDSDSGGSSNPFNRAAEKARSAFDARHRFVISSVYELPFGPGRKFGAGATGVGRKFIEGWQMGLIGSWRAATPFTVDSTYDFHNIGRTSVHRLDLAGDPNTGPKTAQQWFNTAAFVNPVRGSFGTAGRNIVAGDTFTSWDFSLLKDTTLTERVKLQFRAEIFNLANHTNFGTPGRTYVPALNPIVPPATVADYTPRVSNNTNAEYGRMFGASDPRVAQIALKLYF